jgi:tetratricopeptide (TPR) repeat protein/DNA-binding XRE family transcriptional regulator
MTKRIPTAEGAVLRLFRQRKGVTPEELARLAHVSPTTIRLWENGVKPLDRERLVEVLAHLDVPPEAVDAALFADRLAGPPEAPGRGRRLVGRAAAAGGWAGLQAARTAVSLDLLLQQAPVHRRWAERVWRRMKRTTAAEQERVVELLLGDERSWALAVRLCTASEAAAAHRADEALRLARLAVRLARQAPDLAGFRQGLLGHCEPFVGNALRVGGDLPGARDAFARADRLWSQGEGSIPASLLDRTRRLDLKASLLRQDGKHAEALGLIDQALAGSPPEAEARLLLKKATTHARAGDYELALEVLRQTEPRIDPRREPRLLCVLQFNRSNCLCHLERYREAESLLPLIEALAADLRTELDGVRSLWIRGRASAGLGRREEAIAALSRVRRYFLAERIAFDFALASVELATLHLEKGQTRRAQELAAEMVWIFDGQQVHQEALAALALFCQAAREEEASAEWTRRLVKYLYRAQYNPDLRFEP